MRNVTSENICYTPPCIPLETRLTNVNRIRILCSLLSCISRNLSCLSSRARVSLCRLAVLLGPSGLRALADCPLHGRSSITHIETMESPLTSLAGSTFGVAEVEPISQVSREFRAQLPVPSTPANSSTFNLVTTSSDAVNATSIASLKATDFQNKHPAEICHLQSENESVQFSFAPTFDHLPLKCTCLISDSRNMLTPTLSQFSSMATSFHQNFQRSSWMNQSQRRINISRHSDIEASITNPQNEKEVRNEELQQLNSLTHSNYCEYVEKQKTKGINPGGTKAELEHPATESTYSSFLFSSSSSDSSSSSTDSSQSSDSVAND
ncbi:unnamed protein product, partial [Protopolystoma xenopodis]